MADVTVEQIADAMFELVKIHLRQEGPQADGRHQGDDRPVR